MNTSNSVGISTLLCLPAPDVKALGNGRSICAITALFLRPGQKFLLCPIEILDGADRLEWFYRSEFCQEAKQALDALEYDLPEINFWATCERSIIVDTSNQIEALASLSIWRKDWLLAKLDAKKSLFISVLRIHKLATSFSLPAEITYQEKIGRFLSLQAPHERMKSSPVLSDPIFARRKQQLEKFAPPEHPNLETLQSAIAHYAQAHPEAQALNHDLRVFLGWADRPVATAPTAEWVTEITTSGNSSDGDLFEKQVRQSFVHLGFTNTRNDPKVALDPEAAGGAGGIDFYCELPYPIVGECKASKDLKVNDNKDGAPFQLIKLGQKYLHPGGFSRAIKIIMAPGELTKDANLTAIGNQMNVMRPETLQRLVELKAAHPGAIDLLELKPCLETAPFGTDADAKVNQFIDRVWQKIKVRSQIIQAVKTLKEDGDHLVTASDVRTRFNAFADTQDKLAAPENAHDLLVELSSPLTGYLGRNQCETWRGDRFYFLRDLVVGTR
jgi:hypothetical protein